MDRMIITLERIVEGEKASVVRMLNVGASERSFLGLGVEVERLHGIMKQQLDEYAERAGINLGEATREKFNQKSRELGSNVAL